MWTACTDSPEDWKGLPVSSIVLGLLARPRRLLLHVFGNRLGGHASGYAACAKSWLTWLCCGICRMILAEDFNPLQDLESILCPWALSKDG